MNKHITYILIIINLLFFSCTKPTYQFPKEPYTGGELRTDGFYYTNLYYHDRNNVPSDGFFHLIFLYRDGLWFEGVVFFEANDINMISQDSIEHVISEYPWYYNNINKWGAFKIRKDRLYWTMCEYRGMEDWYTSLDSAYILNDTTFVKVNYTSQNNGCQPYNITYHFHQFSYKPDSSVAYQWIP